MSCDSAVQHFLLVASVSSGVMRLASWCVALVHLVGVACEYPISPIEQQCHTPHPTPPHTVHRGLLWASKSHMCDNQLLTSSLQRFPGAPPGLNTTALGAPAPCCACSLAPDGWLCVEFHYIVPFGAWGGAQVQPLTQHPSTFWPLEEGRGLGGRGGGGGAGDPLIALIILSTHIWGLRKKNYPLGGPVDGGGQGSEKLFMFHT